MPVHLMLLSASQPSKKPAARQAHSSHDTPPGARGHPPPRPFRQALSTRLPTTSDTTSLDDAPIVARYATPPPRENAMPRPDRDSKPAAPPQLLLSTVASALPDSERDLAELLFALGADAIPPPPAAVPEPMPVRATAPKPPEPRPPPPAAASAAPRRSAWKRTV